MAAAPAIIAGISAAIAAGTTGYQISDSLDQQHQAHVKADEQKAAQDKILNDQKNQADAQTQAQSDAEKKAAAEALRNQTASNQPGAGSLGRGGTILTSPLGIPSYAATGSKTILGG